MRLKNIKSVVNIRLVSGLFHLRNLNINENPLFLFFSVLDSEYEKCILLIKFAIFCLWTPSCVPVKTK